jgi:hypothetical protein
LQPLEFEVLERGCPIYEALDRGEEIRPGKRPGCAISIADRDPDPP